ncbi:hypothetical protein C0J52_16449 [Blattella germanica]|nr:hypothetical protein C0J52_16449 [Blattella germanica]
MLRLLAVSPDPAQLVVMRNRQTATSLLSTTSLIHQQDHSSRELTNLREELGTLRGRAEDAERAKDTFRSDNLRLTHRISYLEEQVSELLQRTKDDGEITNSNTQTQTRVPAPSLPKNGTVPNTPVSTPVKTPVKSDVQVFQKGPQVTALVANLPGLDVGANSPSESRHSLPTVRPKQNAPTPQQTTKNQDARSTKSLDFGSDCSSGGLHHHHHHHRHEKHSHRHHHHHHLQNARSTNSLDLNKMDGTATLQHKSKHHSHQRLYEAARSKNGEHGFDYNSEASSGVEHSRHYHRKNSEQILSDMKSKLSVLDHVSESPGSNTFHRLHDARSVKSLDIDSESSSTQNHYIHERNHTSSHHSQDTQSTRSLDYGSEPSSHTNYRNYKKHHQNYQNGNSSCSEGKPQRPTPPKKPLRLSLHRATSLQSVNATPSAPPSPGEYMQQGSKKPIKRNHKGEAPPAPVLMHKDPPQPPPRTPSRAESCQSALRWPSPAAALHQAVSLKTARNGTRLSGVIMNEKWC